MCLRRGSGYERARKSGTRHDERSGLRVKKSGKDDKKRSERAEADQRQASERGEDGSGFGGTT